jgi:hypothetical protein
MDTVTDDGVPSSNDLSSPAPTARAHSHEYKPGQYKDLSSPDETPPPPSAYATNVLNNRGLLECLGDGPQYRQIHKDGLMTISPR